MWMSPIKFCSEAYFLNLESVDFSRLEHANFVSRGKLVQKVLPIKPILSRINPVPRIDAYLFNIYSDIFLSSSLGFPKGIFLVCFTFKTGKALLLSSILVTCPAHLLDLIALPIFGKWFKLWDLLHSSFPSLMGTNIRFSFLFSNSLSRKLSLNARVLDPQLYKTTENLIL